MTLMPTRRLLRTGERPRAPPSPSAAAQARRVVERGARAAPEGDPWLGVARCVAAGAAVAAAGTAERAFLERAFARVCELEMRRAGAVRAVAATLVHAYRQATCCQNARARVCRARMTQRDKVPSGVSEDTLRNGQGLYIKNYFLEVT